MFDQPKVRFLVKQHFGDFCRAPHSIGRPEPTFLSVQPWAVSCDSVLSAVTGCGPFTTGSFPECLAVGKTVSVDSCCPYITDDDLVFFLRMGPVSVDLFSEKVVRLAYCFPLIAFRFGISDCWRYCGSSWFFP